MSYIKESKENCVFCKIIAGSEPVSIIYEDEEVMVFPTLHPVNEGHLLIIPKFHAPYLSDLPESTAMSIMKMAKRLNDVIRRSGYRCEGVNLFLADGEAAHQEVFHLHLHIYPRYFGDGFGFKYDPMIHFLETGRKDLDAVAARLKELIGRLNKI